MAQLMNFMSRVISQLNSLVSCWKEESLLDSIKYMDRKLQLLLFDLPINESSLVIIFISLCLYPRNDVQTCTPFVAQLKLSKSSILFERSRLNQLARRAVYIENSSNKPLRYSITTEPVYQDSGSIFPLLLGDHTGSAPETSRILLIFGFFPVEHGCFAKKVEIFVEDQVCSPFMRT